MAWILVQGFLVDMARMHASAEWIQISSKSRVCKVPDA